MDAEGSSTSPPSPPPLDTSSRLPLRMERDGQRCAGPSLLCTHTNMSHKPACTTRNHTHTYTRTNLHGAGSSQEEGKAGRRPVPVARPHCPVKRASKWSAPSQPVFSLSRFPSAAPHHARCRARRTTSPVLLVLLTWKLQLTELLNGGAGGAPTGGTRRRHVHPSHNLHRPSSFHLRLSGPARFPSTAKRVSPALPLQPPPPHRQDARLRLEHRGSLRCPHRGREGGRAEGAGGQNTIRVRLLAPLPSPLGFDACTTSHKHTHTHLRARRHHRAVSIDFNTSPPSAVVSAAATAAGPARCGGALQLIGLATPPHYSAASTSLSEYRHQFVFVFVFVFLCAMEELPTWTLVAHYCLAHPVTPRRGTGGRWTPHRQWLRATVTEDEERRSKQHGEPRPDAGAHVRQRYHRRRSTHT